MNLIISGPMAERAKSGVWESFTKKDGAHYNNYGCSNEHGMEGLRKIFPTGEADEYNFVLFSTSGVHGSYSTIEEVENASPDEEGYTQNTVTFVIVHPRVCCLRCGNCIPKTPEDFEFLKRLRETSWAAMAKIGA